MSTPSPALAAACLSAGLVSAWAPSALGDVQTQIDVSTSGLFGSVSHAVLLLAGLGSGGGPELGVTISNLTITPLANLTYISGLDISRFGDSYAMIGLSQGTGSEPYHLVLSAGGLTSVSGLTSLSGLSFEQAFPGFSESQMIDQLLIGGQGVEFFLRTEFAVLRQRQGFAADCFSFSNAAPFGTVTVNVVPTPNAALALLPLGYLTQFRRRRA